MFQQKSRKTFVVGLLRNYGRIVAILNIRVFSREVEFGCFGIPISGMYLKQMLTCFFISPILWHLSVVYGSNSASVRKELWRELMRISQVVQGPWLVAGDFNTVKEVYEINQNGRRDLYVPQLKSFYDCLQFCHLFDMRARGH